MLKKELMTLIEKKRAELIQVAISSGFTSSVAIRYSQELDQLLNEYNRTYLQKVSTSSY
ncbi:aspartyl-phosphate phosphatase Spo0E family protein [Bacillus sp. BRMEA1]|uniref:aspartyl-phosphate phosphatase Spo0E family protein n=1 Tax=Neobacillus endophyticus TaxID=2738405 RepID=UPI0015632735|nr:aspartyl-phosphate phosphatase Spo0E family protein [Neobacillus endophyticus]NRD79067.1 aspartyl-phosphate phosphatase Spo0E family protein [Neobacillus endophyticus]